jgi:hypothetical protein
MLGVGILLGMSVAASVKKTDGSERSLILTVKVRYFEPLEPCKLI